MVTYSTPPRPIVLQAQLVGQICFVSQIRLQNAFFSSFIIFCALKPDQHMTGSSRTTPGTAALVHLLVGLLIRQGDAQGGSTVMRL